MRCDWSTSNNQLIEYHDKEWGVPVHDDNELFGHLALDSFQAGLSWSTILKKRDNFRDAFDNFIINKVAGYDDNKVIELLNNNGIIRNRLKIEATINNARSVQRIQKEFGSFDHYIWSFTKHTTLFNNPESMSDIPATSPESDAMSKSLKKNGFKFVGSTICYAFMQAVGMANDHITGCFRYEELKNRN